MRVRLEGYYIIAILMITSLSGFAQQTILMNYSDSSIIIDGKLEDIWHTADSSSGFTQLEPLKGEPASRKTVVRAIQNDDFIYLSFACYINDPNEIAARIQQRDRLDESDDIISVILDTYDDNRTGLIFQINPLSTVSDAKISDDGKVLDYLWDTEWDAAASVNENHWIVELRIPFKSIQYKPGTTTWGCNFSRSIRVNNEIVWWSPVTENYRISQNGSLTNIRTSNKEKHSLDLFPYATLRYANTNISEIEDGFKPGIGGDIEYKYSSNFRANLTINPDFATVEGDEEQINLTPWELKFPDKRLFFQDGNEMFKTRIQTFYSRRIGDILYGGKMTGKIDKFQFNGLHAQTKDYEEIQLPKAKFNAIRLKRDVLSSSTIGFTYTDKVTDSVTFRSYNLDYVFNLGKTWKLTGQFVASTPGDFQSYSAWFVRFARENNIYHYHVRFTSLGKNFQDNVNQTGFIPDDDRLEVDSDIEYTFWINSKMQYLFLSGKNNMFWSQEGTLRSWRFTYGSRMYFSNKLNFDVYYRDEFQLLDKKYYNHYYHFISGYNTDEASFAALAYRFGRNFDRDFQLAELNTSFKILKNLSISYELNFLNFSPDSTHESTWLNILGLDYYFTNNLWMRIFAQSNSSTHKIYFYGLFGWRFKPPFGALYLIVNTNNYLDISENKEYYSEIVFLKLTVPISVIKR